MTYAEVVARLSLAGSTEPENEAFLLLSELFGADRSALLLFPEKEYSSDKLDRALTRRETGEPIQYIIGRVFFYGYEFSVSRDCLIPRSDTEILCDSVISLLPQNAHFLELCTGSGCIPISVLKERPDVTCESVELFDATLELARKNREINALSADRLTFRCADALELPVEKYVSSFDAIVSNPPYIRTDALKTLSREVLCEPNAALDGGADGMIFYNKFLKSYAPMLKKGGFFAFEIGYDQAGDIISLCKQLGYSCEIRKDYSGNDRVALIYP